MKSSKQIADYVFKARDEHNQKKRKKIIMIKRISAFGTLGCTVAAVLACSFNILPKLEENQVEVIPPSQYHQYTAYHSDSEVQTTPSLKTTQTLVSPKPDTENELRPTESQPATVVKPVITNAEPLQGLTSVTKPAADTENSVSNNKHSVTLTEAASVTKPAITGIVSQKPSQTTNNTEKTTEKITKKTTANTSKKTTVKTTKKTTVKTTAKTTKKTTAKTTKKTTAKTTKKTIVNTNPPQQSTAIVTNNVVTTKTRVITTEYIPVTKVTYLTEFITQQPAATDSTNDLPPNATITIPPGMEDYPSRPRTEILQNVQTLTLPNGNKFASLGYTVEQSMISNFIYNYNTITIDETSNKKYSIDISVYKIVNKDSNIYIAAKSQYGNTFFVYKLSE